jgi:UDP-glucose 4-epimerase
VPTACRAIINGQPEAFGSLFQWRDFLHVTDLARGIVALTRSDLEGAVNIGSGGPARLNFLLDTLEKLSGRSDLFQRGARKDPENDPPILFADVAKLAQTGWLPLVGYEEGLANALNYWRDELT